MNTKRKLALSIYIIIALLAVAPAAQGAEQAAPGPLSWQDNFNAMLLPGWAWVNENPGEWSLDVRRGFLTIWTSPMPTGGQNLLLRQAPAGDFMIETRLEFEPFDNFEFAGMVLWQDAANFLQFGRAYCDIADICAGNALYFDFIQPGEWRENFATPVDSPGVATLRLLRQGTSVKAYYSPDGAAWAMIGEHILPEGFQINSVGLTSAQHYNTEVPAIPADFGYFALRDIRPQFIGEWQAIDVDGGAIRLTIGGPPAGPFLITWTESYFGFCGGEAGIARGSGSINPDDPYLLDASLRLVCFTTGDVVDFYPSWRYDPATGWLTSADQGYGGFVTTWHRPGTPLPLTWDNMLAHPDEEWVEGWGFAEGTVVSLYAFTVDGAHFAIGTEVASVPEWEPNSAWVPFYLDFDLQAGDRLVMSDGMVAKELTLTNLQITGIDLFTQVVTGFAAPFSEVIIEYFPEGEPALYFTVFADADGNWAAEVPGLTPGVPGLASQADEDGDLTRLTFMVPRLDLRVNYGDDWVESFFPADHTVEITVTDGTGSPKASATMVTAPQDFWDGAEGFQTRPEDWSPAPPDIQPDDWVYASVDSGQTAQVQIGEIAGVIDLESDSITGVISATWFLPELVSVECHPWGAPPPPEGEEPVEMKFASILANGADTYTCSWAGEWDLKAGETVGVGYFGPDNHWVANTFWLPAIIKVTSIDDVLADDGLCTLREAVIAANTNSPSGDSPGECPGGLEFATDTILLSPDEVYSLIIDSTGEDSAYDGDLDLLDNSPPVDLVMRVDGGGAATISQDASVDDRVLHVMATVEIEGLTLTGGSNVEVGGGVLNSGGTLSLSASAITGNTADQGGGIFNDESGALQLSGSAVSGNSANRNGGGVWNFGALTVDASSISTNTTTFNGGGLFNYQGTAVIQNGSVIGGDPDAGEGNVANLGGGMTVWSGSVTIDSSTVSGNSVSWDGGGVRVNKDGDQEGTLTVLNSTIASNSAEHYGGGIVNEATAFVDGSIISYNTTLLGGGINNVGTMEVSNSTIEGNSAAADGGGIYNDVQATLNLSDSTITGNSADYGGGLALWGGNVTLTGVSVTGNSVTSSGGGIHNKEGGALVIEGGSQVSGNTAEWDGGGINNWDSSVIIDGSSVTWNSTVSGSGGGILNGGSLVIQSASELSANSAWWTGGGLLNLFGAVATVDSSTVSGNIALNGGGGGISNDGSLALIGSRLSGNASSHNDGGGIFNHGELVVDSSTLSGNSAPGSGGGALANLPEAVATIQNGSLIGGDPAAGEANTAGTGGGLFNYASLTVIDSTVAGNTAVFGGGISNWGGALALSNSTVSNNFAADSSGGIHNQDDGTVTVENNSFISGNNATNHGGGVNNWFGAILISASTVSGNTAGDLGGGISNGDRVTVQDGSLLSDNEAARGDALYSATNVPFATSVTDSCIVGNGEFAFLNETGAMQIASGNWWGDPSGPFHPVFNPDGTGDSVFGLFDISAWLTSPPSICTLP